MFFVASVTIADRHPELREEISGLDRYLLVNDGHPIRVHHAAGILRLDRHLVRRLLDSYQNEGVVKGEVGYICPDCDGFMARVPGEGDLWCDICEKTFTFRGRSSIGEQVWRTLPGARKTGLSCALEELPANVPVAQPVVVQVIAGDRGGGLTTQVQVPREAKEIEDAITHGTYRTRFRFAQPVFAASLADVIACHRSHPTIVHFSGHGSERRLLLVDDRDVIVEPHALEPEQLETLFKSYPTRVRLVFFNTCHSHGLASHLVGYGVVDLAIGVEETITDHHAIRFAASFYRQLADGLSVESAFNLAGLQLGKTRPSNRPQLLCAEGIDAGEVIFASAE